MSVIKAAPDRIDTDELGVDDVVISDVAVFRLERMDRGSFWIRLYREDKPDIVMWATAKSLISVSAEED